MGSSSSRISGRANSSAASRSRTDSPPETSPMVRSRPMCSRPSWSRTARERSSTSQSSPTAVKFSSLASPFSMACRAARAFATPRASSTRRAVSRWTACGRWPTSPAVRTDPRDGLSSPAISLSRVDFPEPLSPTRPVRPGPAVKWKSSNTGVPSGQAKRTPEQTMDAADGAESGMGPPVALVVWGRGNTRRHRRTPCDDATETEGGGNAKALDTSGPEGRLTARGRRTHGEPRGTLPRIRCLMTSGEQRPLRSTTTGP